MNEEHVNELRKNIVAIGRILWEKNLATGLNGNISVRVDENTILLTAHSACLGLLQEEDVLLMKVDGELLEEGEVSTEHLLHTSIYQNFADMRAVIHTHTSYTNAYFLKNKTLEPQIFEARFHLGSVPSVDQTTPSVQDATPVIDALKTNNIVVLRNHGVVAMGKELFDSFLLIQALEEAVKTDAISRLYDTSHKSPVTSHKTDESSSNGKYKLFSQEQFDKIVELVNKDQKLAQLGEQTDMTFDMAVKLNETGQTYRFAFDKGKITDLDNNENAEFVVSAPENVWRSVFNREIDPFVATTQKKMQLDGDFAKISKWYAPCSRVFEIWQEVPVE